jgi:hypothetical protein
MSLCHGLSFLITLCVRLIEQGSTLQS